MSELNEVIPENTGEVQETRDEAGRFIKGVSGNPDGKPKGAKNKFSFVRYWQERWEEDPEEFKQLATEFMKDDKLRGLIIQMVDGRPNQHADIDTTVVTKAELTDEQLERIIRQRTEDLDSGKDGQAVV